MAVEGRNGQVLGEHEEHAVWGGPLTGLMEFYCLSEAGNGIVRDGRR